MAYIGSTPTSQNFISGTDYFNGTGSQTAFTLTRSVNSVNDVEVVVNNFGSEKATTKETTDSRGNRKIEVVIGDMVAGEIGRSGSSIQQSLSGNFGTRQALARR